MVVRDDVTVGADHEARSAPGDDEFLHVGPQAEPGVARIALPLRVHGDDGGRYSVHHFRESGSEAASLKRRGPDDPRGCITITRGERHGREIQRRCHAEPERERQRGGYEQVQLGSQGVVHSHRFPVPSVL